jgi:iron complex outermembrane recepter protein
MSAPCSWRSCLWMLAFLAVPALSHAQGRISGTVRDSRGTPRSGAIISISNNTTGSSSRTTTTADGSYVVAGLPSGTYTVSASLIGYRLSAQTSVQVTGPTTVDFTLEQLPLQAVVVTATLREQELIDVPFSVAAPTAQTLRERGAEGIEGIAANVAGFTVQNLGPGQSQVAIRGASAGQIARDQPGVKEQAGVYLDDSPISLSLFTPDLDLFDVSRVEVLRGPQGTLFGSGSLAGNVRYISNQPELGVHSTFGEVGSSWINGGSVGANARIGANVPLGERSAGRVVLYHSKFPGYMDAVQPDLGVKEDVNTGSRTGVRAALKLQPSDQLSIVPRLVFQTVRMNGWNRIDAFNILANPYTTSRPKVTLGPRQLFTQIPEPFTDDFVMGDVNIQYDFGGARLTSVSTYALRDILVVRDATALTASITGGSIGLPERVYSLNAPLDDKTSVNVWTQELRLSGAAERLRWLVGGFLSGNDRAY